MNPVNLLKVTKIILSLKVKVKCRICLDFVDNTAQLGCEHQFCNNCLQQVKLQTSPLCPLCQTPITKRAAVFKDQFADDLSKFVDQTCQLIKETYAHEVDELNTSEDKLQAIIDTAPQDVCRFSASNEIPKSAVKFKKPTKNLFDQLKRQPKWYTNKKGQTKQKEKPNVLPKVLLFSNNDNRRKIINWLNDNQQKFDTLTQSPSLTVSDDDDADFELPSISQVPFRVKQKPSNRVRSQSLTLVNKLNEPLMKRYHSLTQGFNEDDYDIEEVHSEALVKQVERRVVQDMLEDVCLDNLEHLAQQSELNKEKSPRKARKSISKKKSPISDISSGWNRIKDVKKSIKKAAKEPKQLNINLQETSGTVKSPGEKVNKAAKTKASPKGSSESYVDGIAITKSKKFPEASTVVHNKENVNCVETNSKVDIPVDKASHTFNLSAVEKYFEKNIDKVKYLPDHDTSSDMEMDIIDTSRKKIITSSLPNENNSSVDEDIFLLPTQRTPQSENQSNTLCYIAPVPKGFNDFDSIAIRLTDNLQNCICSATNLNNELAQSLVECFTNLKTYVDKMQTHKSDKKEQEMQASKVKVVAKVTADAQTETVQFSCKEAQTTSSPIKELSAKYIQTSQPLLKNIEAQTDLSVNVGEGAQATELITTTRVTKEKITHSIRYGSPPPDTSNEDYNDKNPKKTTREGSSQTRKVENPKSDDKVISVNMSRSSSADNQERHISVDSSKQSKTGSKNISQDSLLICSVEPTASSKLDKKIKRKLTYEGSQNRSFKRIRRPASDSDSDEDAKPNKRRLVRDDLTVEFADTERENKDDSRTKADCSPESENMDNDKYLMEVMAKYGTPPPENSPGDENQSRSKIKESTGKKRNTQHSPNSLKRKSQRPKESQKYSGEHVFTSHVAFEENLAKFEKEIYDYEHTTKALNTDCDVIENTPMRSPKPKIPRLQTSNKKETKKNLMNEPVKILSKGSAFSSSTSKRKELLGEDNLSGVIQREYPTLNRNIENVPSQTERCTGEDLAGILKDLQDDDEFFKSAMEFDEQKENIKLSQRKNERSNALDDLPVALTTSKNDEGELNVTQENIDKVVKSLDGFEDDDQIERELEKISFTAEQRKLSEADKARIKILQNIKLKSQDKPVVGSPFDPVIDSDLSDEEIVETTPKKKKHSKDRSLDNFDEVNNNPSPSASLDFCLPPPPGFGDELDTSPAPYDVGESPVNDKDCHSPGEHKSSLTPDSLTAFIVTPDTMMYKEKVESLENENSQQSIVFKSTFLTPSRPSKDRRGPVHSTARFSQILSSDIGDTFSPITKTTVKFTPPKYTPLVSRLSTKKSSLMTSTPNQKSILNYVKPSQGSPSSQPKSKPCIMWSRISKDLHVFNQLELKKLVTTSTSFNPRVTHLVVLVDEKGQVISHTAKLVIAIAAGIWVVRYEWAQDCLKFNRIVPEEPYEALDITGVPGPQIARLTRKTKPLFQGFRFYCADPISTIPKTTLEDILRLSGGEIAQSLDDFLKNDDDKNNIIITESSATENTEQFDDLLQLYKAVTIDMQWLITCIGQYKLVSFRSFLISGDDSNICDLGYPPVLLESVPFTLSEAM